MPGLAAYKNASGAAILNSVRDAIDSSDYNSFIPEATVNNSAQVLGLINANPLYANMFYTAMLNQIGRTELNVRRYDHNPLRQFKMADMYYGATLRDMYFDLIKPIAYSDDMSDADLMTTLSKYPINIYEQYFTINSQLQYPVSINHTTARRGFTNDTEVLNFLTGILTSVVNSDRNGEYLQMKQAIDNFNSLGGFYNVQVTAITDKESAQAFIAQAQGYAEAWRFFDNKYNFMGFNTFCNPEDTVLLIDPFKRGLINVYDYAEAFNIDRAEIPQRVITISGFADSTIQAVLMDRNAFRYVDALYGFTHQENGKGRFWNHFLNHDAMYYINPFANAIKFSTAATTSPAITSIDVQPAAVTAPKGGTVNFTAQFNATAGISKLINWTITGNASTNTKIVNGQLLIGRDETAQTITVKATSEATSTVSDTATVTVSGNAA